MWRLLQPRVGRVGAGDGGRGRGREARLQRQLQHLQRLQAAAEVVGCVGRRHAALKVLQGDAGAVQRGQVHARQRQAATGLRQRAGVADAVEHRAAARTWQGAALPDGAAKEREAGARAALQGSTVPAGSEFRLPPSLRQA